jgi:uncharacterized membrane protein
MGITVSEKVYTHNRVNQRADLWQRGLLALCIIALFALALWLYQQTLNVPFDRDSYDEGVYWQTLRAMSAGNTLYSPTFYSQPPAFLLSIYPTYILFGQTLWSARLGIAIIGLIGLLGAFLLGKALRGNIAGLIGLALLIVNPAYLQASQTIEAEGPQVAFSMLAIGFAYFWWERPSGKRGLCYASLCTLTLALSIFSKLFGLAALVPIGLLVLAHCWRVIQQTRQAQSFKQQTRSANNTGFAPFISLILGCAVFLIATILILLPFAGVFQSFWSEVIAFHTSAIQTSTTTGNSGMIRDFLLQNFISYTALYGTLVALLRRDWRVIPLLAWLLTLVYLLWRQAPLFGHHLVILVPVLVGLSIMGFGPLQANWKSISRWTYATSTLCLMLVLYTLVTNVRADRAYYRAMNVRAHYHSTSVSIQAAHDLQAAITPQQLVVTDGQFIAALANRSTPPELVDTSTVRIHTGSVTSQQIIQLASQPRVHAILFYTGRFQNITGFSSWVKQHFQLVHTYGNGQELWVKINGAY